MLQGSIFPIDDDGMPIEDERQQQQAYYYVKQVAPDVTDPDDDGRRIYWDEPEQPYELVEVTPEQAESGLPYRAQYRQERDPTGRQWGWELIQP